MRRTTSWSRRRSLSLSVQGLVSEAGSGFLRDHSDGRRPAVRLLRDPRQRRGRCGGWLSMGWRRPAWMNSTRASRRSRLGSATITDRSRTRRSSTGKTRCWPSPRRRVAGHSTYLFTAIRSIRRGRALISSQPRPGRSSSRRSPPIANTKPGRARTRSGIVLECSVDRPRCPWIGYRERGRLRRVDDGRVHWFRRFDPAAGDNSVRLVFNACPQPGPSKLARRRL